METTGVCLPFILKKQLFQSLRPTNPFFFSKNDTNRTINFWWSNNERNQLNIKEIKVYSSKQLMLSFGSIKTKAYKWRLALATL